MNRPNLFGVAAAALCAAVLLASAGDARAVSQIAPGTSVIVFSEPPDGPHRHGFGTASSVTASGIVINVDGTDETAAVTFNVSAAPSSVHVKFDFGGGDAFEVDAPLTVTSTGTYRFTDADDSSFVGTGAFADTRGHITFATSAGFPSTYFPNSASSSGPHVIEWTMRGTVCGLPILTPPPDVTVECTDDGAFDVDLGQATVDDPCNETLTPTNDGASFYPFGDTVVTWTVTDSAGHTVTATQTVHVVDTLPPTLTPPADVTVECAGPGGTTASLGTATASDQCCGTLTPTNNAPATFSYGDTTVTWSVSDCHGHTVTATQVVHVVDTLPPTLTPPADVTVECAGPGGTTASLGAATASDQCCGTLTPTNNAPATFSYGDTTVTWSVSDCHGHTVTGTQVVHVVDTLPPTLTPPGAVTAECAGPNGTTVNLGTATASDQCCGTLTPTNNAPATFSYGDTTVTWSVSDCHGHTTTATQVVHVVDTLSPTLTPPGAVTAECAGPNGTTVNLGTATATDQCCGTLTPTNNAPATFSYGDTTVTWSVSDCHGHTTTATQVVHVVDTLSPTLNVPSAVTAECAGPNGTTVNLGTATASDQCCGTLTPTNNAPATFSYGDTTVTWSVSDCHGHTVTATQVVHVVDTLPPTLTAPPDVTADYEGPNGTHVNLGTATATDQCCGTLTPTNNAPSVFQLGDTTVTWTVSDCHGHTVTDTQIVHVAHTCVDERITSNFNGTSIGANRWIWFNSVIKVSGLPSSTTTIHVSGGTVTSSAFNVTLPDANITYSTSATTATTTYDSSTNTWNTTVPRNYTGNVFLSGAVLALPNGLSGGLNPVNWTTTFTHPPGSTIQWQWAAAVYNTQAPSSLSSLNVKPVDSNSLSSYHNSDHAGTPEAVKSSVVGGARGGGGSNYTGSYSATGSCN